MKTVLIIVTLVEVVLLVAVLAYYLVTIAVSLRKVSNTLGLVTFGVRAIERQTSPIGPVLSDINGALEQVAAALDEVARPSASGPAGPTAASGAATPASGGPPVA